ncbi:MAG TPA: hypothetical protein VMW27_20715 [Thermoanaerobaculia bacterium]|nr:hypothetical protein [Thermoanaerobaculia bacterium]
MTCEPQGGFEVEVLQGSVVEFQVQEGQSLVGRRDLALVGRSVDGLLDHIGFDEALLAVLDVGDTATDSGGFLGGLLSQIVPDVEEGGFDEADHPRGQLKPAQELGEPLFEAIGSDLHLGAAGLHPATVVGIGPACLAAAVGGSERAATDRTTNESPERKVGALFFARRAVWGYGTTTKLELDSRPGGGIHESRMFAIGFDTPDARLRQSLVEGVPQKLGELLKP